MEDPLLDFLRYNAQLPSQVDSQTGDLSFDLRSIYEYPQRRRTSTSWFESLRVSKRGWEAHRRSHVSDDFESYIWLLIRLVHAHFVPLSAYATENPHAFTYTIRTNILDLCAPDSTPRVRMAYLLFILSHGPRGENYRGKTVESIARWRGLLNDLWDTACRVRVQAEVDATKGVMCNDAARFTRQRGAECFETYTEVFHSAMEKYMRESAKESSPILEDPLFDIL